ncbi:MAG: hypothetical protein ACD_7C00362G0003 [uncultured bacterium]|nr:MAG: hypothetical protein ACD_7C00362G0003 [uncultured bacterium]
MRFEVTGNNAREAFLYVIYAYNAFAFDKKAMLSTIVKKCPEVLNSLTEGDILGAFRDFYGNTIQRGEIMSPAEFEWVSQYVKDSYIRKEMEKLLYRSLLSASSHHDGTRHAFSWTINEDEKKEVANEVLENSNLRSKRKMQIAKEFNKPSEQFEIEYLHRLLWDRHYDKAEAFGIKNDEVVITVILENINAGYIGDAAEIASRFLPDRQDIADEIEKIKTAIN